MNEVGLDQMRRAGALGNETLYPVEPTDGSMRVVQPGLSALRDAVKMSRELILYTKAMVCDNVAITAGDVIGVLQSFPGVVPQLGQTLRLQSICIIDMAAQRAALDVVLWDRNPSGATIAHNTAFAWGGTAPNVIGTFRIAATDYDTAVNGVAVGGLKDVNLDLTSLAETSLYAAFIAAGTPTYLASPSISIYAKWFFQLD